RRWQLGPSIRSPTMPTRRCASGERPWGQSLSGWPSAACAKLSTIVGMPVPAPSPDARAVVTGASQNIGEALANELAARGHHLIVTARREDVLTALAARLTDRYGVTVEVRAVDLADPTARGAFCDDLGTRNVSILCANAGTATFGPIAGLDVQGEKDQVQLNVIGVHDLVL